MEPTLKFIKRGDVSRVHQDYAGVAIKAGQVVAHDLDQDNKLMPALAIGHLWKSAGIATHDAAKGELVTFVIEGECIFAPKSFDVAYVYVVSPNVPGLLIQHDSLGDVGHLGLVGYAASDSVLEVINLQARKPAVRAVRVVAPVVAPATVSVTKTAKG